MRIKRGQAAVEFLATYGWAILVVSIGIGALAYFGVLNPNMLVPERCILGEGFKCNDFVFNTYTGSVVFSIQNAGGKDVTLNSVTLNGRNVECTLDKDTYPMNMKSAGNQQGVYLQAGGSRTISVPCTQLEASSKKERSELRIGYKLSNEAGLDHVAQGELVATPANYPWPTQDMCKKAFDNGLCVHLQEVFGAKEGFRGFACECNQLYKGKNGDCTSKVAC